MDESTSDHTHPPSRQQAAVGGSRASSKATHAPSAKLWKQVNVHHTLRPLLGPPRTRSLHSTSLPYRGYVGGPDGPACMVSWVPGAAQPSRWLLRTIWLSYAIQFARRPPKFRGIHLTAVKAADAHLLWEESLSYWRRTWWYRSLQPIWWQGFSALHCAQEKRWVTTNLGSVHLELGLS